MKTKKQIIPIGPEPVTERPPEPKYKKTTPQSMADGFDIYAETITKALNNFAYRQKDSEFKRLYDTYRQMIESLHKLTKKYLKKSPDLPEPPTLLENDYYAGMIYFVAHCKRCAAILRGKPKAKKTPKSLSAQAKAIAILIEHPDWTDTRIAEEAGINRTTLYDLPEFVSARALIKETGKKDYKHHGTHADTQSDRFDDT